MLIETNRQYFDDCYNILTQMDDGCVDLMVQDTPFEVTQNDWDIAPDFDKMWPEWLRVGKQNCAYLFFATQPFAADLINSNRKMFRYDLIWDKSISTGFLNANKMPLRSHETILIFYKNLPTYNPQMVKGKMKMKGGYDRGSTNYGKYDNRVPKVNDTYYPKSILEFSHADRQGQSDHPTQKPVDLIRYLIKTYSNEGELVFDGYGGSGTTTAACIEENRRYVVCENKKEYFDMSEKRVDKMLSAPKLF